MMKENEPVDGVNRITIKASRILLIIFCAEMLVIWFIFIGMIS